MVNFETWFFWPWTVWCSISGKVPSVKYLWWALVRKSVHVFLLQYYNSQNFQSCTSCRFNQLKTVFVNWILFPEFLDWLFWNKAPRFYIPQTCHTWNVWLLPPSHLQWNQNSMYWRKQGLDGWFLCQMKSEVLNFWFEGRYQGWDTWEYTENFPWI